MNSIGRDRSRVGAAWHSTTSRRRSTTRFSLGSEGLGKKTAVKRILVLVSDGGDTASSTSYQQAQESALRNEVMIYSIIDVPIAASAGRDLGGEHALITLAEQTGGKSFYVSDGGLDKAFAQVSDDLRTQYLIGYYPHKL